MAVIREHFAAKGLGLHNDLQNEHSIVGNFPFVEMFEQFATSEEQKQLFILGGFEGKRRTAFGRSEEHTSELQSLMRISYAVFCLKKKTKQKNIQNTGKLKLYHRVT